MPADTQNATVEYDYVLGNDKDVVAALEEILDSPEGIKTVVSYDADGKPSFKRGYRTSGQGETAHYVCQNAKAQECHIPKARVDALLKAKADDKAPAKGAK